MFELTWGGTRMKHRGPKGERRRQTQEEKTFCYFLFLFVQSTTNHCVSFGCRASGFHHGECSSGGPTSSTAWLLLTPASTGFTWRLSISWSKEHYRPSHRNLTSQKKQAKKKKKTTGSLYTTKNVKRKNKLFGWRIMEEKKQNITAVLQCIFLSCRQAPPLWHEQLTVRGT